MKKPIKKKVKAFNKKCMIVKSDGFPYFLCHNLGKIYRENGETRYEFEGTGTSFSKKSIIKVVSRFQGDLIKELIYKARASRSDAIDNLDRGIITHLENNINDIIYPE